MNTKMFAISALCATVAITASAAEIVSSDVVGYNQVGLKDGGTKMVGACFVSVGGGEKVKLSELKVTGYENSTYYLTEAMEFSASFQILQPNGMPAVTYMWADATSDLENWDGGKWVNLDTNTDVTKENDVELTPGTGFWFTAPDLQDCTAFTLTSSGAVLKGDQAFKLLAGGTIAVCNMLPATTTLSKIEIQGYEDSVYYLTEAMEFSMSMQKLLPSGMPEVTYMWADATSDLENWDGGKWINLDTNLEVTTDNDVTIEAGEGFWATAPDLQDCTSFSFVIPKVID